MRRALAVALVGGAASAPAEKRGSYTLRKYDCGQDATCTQCAEKFSVVNREGCAGPIAPGGGAYINHQCGPDGSFYRMYADAQCTDATSTLYDFPNNACKEESGTFVKYYSDCNAPVSVESVAAAGADGGTIKLNWSDCGDSSTHGHIASLSPTSVTLGTKTRLVGKGRVDEVMKAATYTVVAKDGFVPIFSHTGDACKPETIKLPMNTGELDMKGFKCPISPGSLELDLDLTLSSIIPAKLAHVTIELTAQSSTGDKALCAKINASPATTADQAVIV